MNNNNNSVVINGPNANSPILNSNPNNNNVGNIRPRRLNFGNSPRRVASPPKAPRKINVSKYEKMLKNLEIKKKTPQKNNKPNPENNNVANWFNNGGLAANKSNIPKDKRAFLLVDVTVDVTKDKTTGDVTRKAKIRHVYDKRYLWGIIRAWEKGFNENMGSREMVKSPITKKPFGKGDIRSYPPDKRSKMLMDRIVFKNKVDKMKYTPPNGEMNKNWENMVSFSKGYLATNISAGRIKTEQQLDLLILVHQIVGPKEFTSYIRPVLNGEFKPHHIEMMKKVPKTVTLFFDSSVAGRGRRIFKLTEDETKEFIKLDPKLTKAKNKPYNRNAINAEEKPIIYKLDSIAADAKINNNKPRNKKQKTKK
jgi:hypothetical protein